MGIKQTLLLMFEKIPEWSVKNNIREFLSFSKLVPESISNHSPLKGYELYRKLKKGDVVLDAGAYPGDYAVYASKKAGREGKIIAFEPDPNNRKILIKNLKNAGMNNFVVIPKGIWSKKGKLNLEVSDGLHSTLSKEEKGITIDVTTIDSEVARLKLKKVDVIKMDIEGAEVEALKGAKNVLKKFNPFITIASYHIIDGKTSSILVEKFLRALRYNTKSDFPCHLTTYASKSWEF